MLPSGGGSMIPSLGFPLPAESMRKLLRPRRSEAYLDGGHSEPPAMGEGSPRSRRYRSEGDVLDVYPRRLERPVSEHSVFDRIQHRAGKSWSESDGNTTSRPRGNSSPREQPLSPLARLKKSLTPEIKRRHKVSDESLDDQIKGTRTSFGDDEDGDVWEESDFQRDDEIFDKRQSHRQFSLGDIHSVSPTSRPGDRRQSSPVLSLGRRANHQAGNKRDPPPREPRLSPRVSRDLRRNLMIKNLHARSVIEEDTATRQSLPNAERRLSSPASFDQVDVMREGADTASVETFTDKMTGRLERGGRDESNKPESASPSGDATSPGQSGGSKETRRGSWAGVILRKKPGRRQKSQEDTHSLPSFDYRTTPLSMTSINEEPKKESILRKRKGRRQFSHGDIHSLPPNLYAEHARRSSYAATSTHHDGSLEQLKEAIAHSFIGRLRGKRSTPQVDNTHQYLGSVAEVESPADELLAMQDSEVSAENGARVSDLVSDVVMEYKLTSYRVHLASTKAILNLDADAMVVDGDEIIIDDLDDEGVNDPRSEFDPRLRVCYRLLKTEKLYQEALRSIFDVYAEPLRKFSSLTKDDHRVLFFGLEPLLSLSAMLVLKLEDLIQQWDEQATVGNLFSKQFWHHYDEYYTNYKETRNLLKEKRETDEEFMQFCRLRRGAARHCLESLLLLPVQRIPAYASYLTELLEETDCRHPDYEDINRAAAKVKTMVKDREEDLTVVENEIKVENVQDRFPHDNLGLHDREKYIKMKALQSRRRSAPGGMILRTLSKKQSSNQSTSFSSFLPDMAGGAPGGGSRSPGSSVNRLYVLEGPVQLTIGLQTQDRYLFLFSDLMLVAKQKSSTTFKLKHRTRVCEMWLAECLDEVAETTRASERSFVLGWPTTNMVATFNTAETKQLWYTKLQEQIATEKDREQPKTVVLKILNNDMEEYATSKSLAVTNYDQAQEVVKRCMEEFHIGEGKSKDYQLWVLSGKEESPYPLIGHEQPYSIKMSHIRDATRGPDETPPLDVDANDNSIPCQFVLRQARKDPKTVLDEPGIKRNKKSKKSPLMNFFKKSTKHEQVPPSPLAGKLFGHSLCEVSEEDAIPKPIMAILTRLFKDGPSTPGIFRKSANYRHCRELREKLDADEHVDFESVSLFDVAGVLKEFLRSLPDCLLLSDMFDSWIDILEIPDDRQKVEKVKKTLEQLPKPHVNLLRHIMCMLYHIELRNEHNNMNAYNLAICISQSLLFMPPTASGTPTGADKVKCFIQFVIEHVVDIFGEEVLILFGEAPEVKPRQDSSTDSDSMHSLPSLADNTGPRRDDSSLDSLDRDPYCSEVESSPRLKSHMSNTNLSRDSGLTLSDTQLYNDDTSDGNEYPRVLGSPYKQAHYGRSVSHMDETQTKVLTPEMLSRSYDGTLDVAEHPPPVPPPRKNRRRGPETPPGEQPPPGPLSGHHGMRTSNSTGHMAADYMGRLPQYDSLVSLEEGDDEQGSDFSEIQRLLHHQDDRTLIHKSESGACLYIDGQLVHGSLLLGQAQAQQQSEHSHKPEQQDSGRQSWNEMLADETPARDDLSASYGANAPSSLAFPGQQLSASYPQMKPQAKANFTLSSPDSPDLPMHSIPDHPPPPYNANHKTLPVMPCACPPPPEPMQQTVAHVAVRPTNLVLPYQAPSVSKTNQSQTRQEDGASQAGPSAPSAGITPQTKGILRQPSTEFQMDPTMLRKVQKGMTPTGADIFPKHMRSMIRHSLQEEEMRKMVVSRDRAAPVRKQASADGYQRPELQADRQQVLIQMRNARTVEKSASDSSVLEHFQPEESHQKTSEATSGVELRRRPDKPPSYQEAIKRKSLIESGALCYQATEKELMQQRENNMRARQLYEESMRRYMEENKDTDYSIPQQSQQTKHTASPAVDDEDVYVTMTYQPHEEKAGGLNTGELNQTVDEYPRRKDSRKQASNEENNPDSLPDDNSMLVDNREVHRHEPRSIDQKHYQHKEQSQQQRKKQETDSPSNHRLDCTNINVSSRKKSSDMPLSMETKERSVPQKRDNCDHNGRDQSMVSSGGQRRAHSQERTSRENRNNQNERPAKSRSKSREKRHGHRSSDTRLEHARSKEERQLCSSSQLSRSKSDSQEHLNKIAKFKELKPLDSNIIEKCKRAKIEDFAGLTALDIGNESSQRRIQSLKNKDWHRELAEKYNQVFYQPTDDQPNKNLPQYAYIKSTKQEANENERPKRRWTPPVHPTKDLIIKKETEGRQRKNTPPRTIVKSENDFRNGQQYENTRKNLVAEKENRPAETSHSAMPLEPGGDSRLSEGVVSGQQQDDDDFTMGEPNKISWSVARLRNLYDDSNKTEGMKQPSSNGPFYNPETDASRPGPPPYRHPPPANRSSGIPAEHQSRQQQRQNNRSAGEKTNPDAEESYV